MKKIYLSLALVGALAFTACDPAEDDVNNNISSMTADQLQATVTVEQQNGKNVNKVMVTADGNALPIQITNGVNTVCNTKAELLLFGTGENTVYINAQNPDGSVITKEIPVTVEEMYYEVPKEYEYLTNSSSKTWTYSFDRMNGYCWGNAGYGWDTADSSARKNIVENAGGGTIWWGVTNASVFAESQLAHSDTGNATGEESNDATMDFELLGTKIIKKDATGKVINEGTFSFAMNADPNAQFALGTLTTTEGALLWPFQINNHNDGHDNTCKPTEFDILLLTEDEMMLIYCQKDAKGKLVGGWVEATYWSFKAKAE